MLCMYVCLAYLVTELYESCAWYKCINNIVGIYVIKKRRKKIPKFSIGTQNQFCDNTSALASL